MSSINQVILTGRVGGDAEDHDTLDMSHFSMAVENYRGPDKDPETMWVKCQIWGTRRAVAKYITTGMKLTVVGALKIRKVESDGGAKYYTSIDVKELELPDKPKDGNTPSPRQSRRAAPPKSTPAF